MRTDIDNWSPLSVIEIKEVFAHIPSMWGIAGGWALDLHLGKKSREHSDIDVVIFREEQQVVYQSLKVDWILYKAEAGKLKPWKDGEYLESTNDIWVSKNEDSPWTFQIMLIDSENNDWIYRREKSIKKGKNEIFQWTNNGTPYIKPEVQLLYKAGSKQVREKDFKDFQTILPLLLPKEMEWLKLSLKKQFPEGHSWIGFL
ncbi:nucleotidyltransferase domain-containing protein [Viridibacillus arvi]|uniref:Amino acid transporter n=1 Tax=Viridibacillus arvi TaxID=263475 RepID=A0A0M0LFM3_9BACL|nr:hypothetical protein [Viridibacillus arvi]KOO49895.1 hypothetical protein AMD00_16410 [Viridibacillus arvi]